MTYSFVGNFVNSNPACPLIQLAISPIVGGTTGDYSNGPGKVTNLASTISSPSLAVAVPTITVEKRFYIFRVKALASGGATVYTNDVKIKLTNCELNSLTPPNILPNTAGEAFYRMFASDP